MRKGFLQFEPAPRRGEPEVTRRSPDYFVSPPLPHAHTCTRSHTHARTHTHTPAPVPAPTHTPTRSICACTCKSRTFCPFQSARPTKRLSFCGCCHRYEQSMAVIWYPPLALESPGPGTLLCPPWSDSLRCCCGMSSAVAASMPCKRGGSAAESCARSGRRWQPFIECFPVYAVGLPASNVQPSPRGSSPDGRQCLTDTGGAS